MRLCSIFFLLLLSFCSLSAQSPYSSQLRLAEFARVGDIDAADIDAAVASDLPDAPSVLIARSTFPMVEAALPCCAMPSVRTIELIEQVQPQPSYSEKQSFNWRAAASQTSLFLSFQHGMRLLQPKTRAHLDGPFFRDWSRSIRGIRGWGDGDGVITNYVMHPGMGGISSFIYIQNSPVASRLDFDHSNAQYWQSRLKAMAFAAAYSTQFEIGPYSEATIGNVGLDPGTSGFVDFVMTPLGGFAFTVVEDWVDARIARHEQRGLSPQKTRIIRSILNPERSLANLLRGKTPWHRDTRPAPRQ